MSYLFRNKPFIVICGCTGTGKTKLSIELAESLIRNGKKSEIINADAMQLYKNLDIITNKATPEETKNIKHHLIGYLEPTCITNFIIDYRNKAVQLIDDMLKEDKIPIVVGGTHYYIQSIIWNILISDDDTKNSDNKSAQRSLDDSITHNPEIVKLILDTEHKSDLPEGINDLNVRLHDSKILTKEMYNQLELVDLQSAQKIHPNDRRKICRALQIYYTFGKTRTEMLDLKNNSESSQSLRYKNVCLFMMNCEKETLNKRLDDRVDQMIKNGLVNEIKQFKRDFELQFKGETIKNYSRDFEFGIFQSIGFKEFDDYLKIVDNEEKENSNTVEDKHMELFNKCIEEMKLSTRRYAKTQVRWVQNRFIKRADKDSPIVHELDTTFLDKWNDNVFNIAVDTFNSYLKEYESDVKADLNMLLRDTYNKGITERSDNNKIHEFNKCEVCDRVFVNKQQWECHLKSSNHKKKKESLKRREQYKILSEQLDALKDKKLAELKLSSLTESPKTTENN